MFKKPWNHYFQIFVIKITFTILSQADSRLSSARYFLKIAMWWATFSIISTWISRSSSEFDTRFTIVQPFPRLVRLWRLFLQIIDNYFFKQGCSWPRDGRADNVCWWSVRRFRPRRIESKNSGNYTVLYLEHLWV